MRTVASTIAATLAHNRFRLCAAAALLLAAAPAPPQTQAPPPRFDAFRFFTGATEGRGRLKIMLHRTRAIHVTGFGRVAPDGTLVLDQRVEQEGKPTTTRRWHLREEAPGRYAGTLTDASGAVVGEAIGARLHLAYSTKGGVRIDQWLTLSPDARTAHNRLTARKMGVVVARLDETIAKTD